MGGFECALFRRHSTSLLSVSLYPSTRYYDLGLLALAWGDNEFYPILPYGISLPQVVLNEVKTGELEFCRLYALYILCTLLGLPYSHNLLKLYNNTHKCLATQKYPCRHVLWPGVYSGSRRPVQSQS